jgi:alpha-glucuronidase
VKTPLMAELQITQEYLGQSRHLVFLGTMWKELLDSDTFAKGEGSTVGKVLEGGVHPQTLTGMAGVANTGTDTNWCGHDMAQANWYAFGRLAWDHTIPAEHLAEEWARMTFSNDSNVVETVRQMLMGSRETFVRYTMPLGLHHLIGGDHYAPMPWNDRAQRADWTATYYHRADANGIGFDRTRRGSNAVEQYFAPLRDIYDDPGRCPENLLLWFHRCAWNRPMKSGKTLWKELCDTYTQGVAEARDLIRQWDTLKEKIDPDRHKAVAERLAIQAEHAAQWRAQILQYFQRFSGMEIPG